MKTFLICDYFLYKGIANESKKLYGAQFHPEVGLTENGKVILKNFLYDIAGCSGTFTVQNRELECIREIKERVGTSKVLVRNLHLKVYKFMSVMLEFRAGFITITLKCWRGDRMFCELHCFRALFQLLHLLSIKMMFLKILI